MDLARTIDTAGARRANRTGPAWLSPDVVATLLSAVVAFAAGVGIAAFFLPHQYPDFGVFWAAARHASRSPTSSASGAFAA